MRSLPLPADRSAFADFAYRRSGAAKARHPTKAAGPFFHRFSTGCSRAWASRARAALAASMSEERSAAEKLDQRGSLPAAEAGDRLCLGDPAVSKRTIGLRRTDPGYGQQQLAHLRHLHACWRLAKHLRQRNPAGGKVSLQPRPRQTNLVRSCERPQPLLRRACRDGRLAALNPHCAAILRLRLSRCGSARREQRRRTRP